MEYLYQVAKNGTSMEKVKIAKECPRTYFLDRFYDKKVYKIEGNDELSGYNTYCWFFKDEEIAKKWLSSIKNRDFSCKCETKILPNGTQKAIECLEEIITILENAPHEIFKGCEDYYEGRTLIDAYYVEKYIEEKISELKGE